MKLNSIQIEEARKVFGDSLHYRRIWLSHTSWIARLNAKLKHFDLVGVTYFHYIGFNLSFETVPASLEMGWLIHEIAHVWQAEHYGITSLWGAVWAKAWRGGYVYGQDSEWQNDQNALALKAHRRLKKFNIEQQAEIARHYYLRLTNGLDTEAWRPYIYQFKARAFT